MTGTFDYVAYDENHLIQQEGFKHLFIALEQAVLSELPAGRARSLVSTKLEEAYMWVGKAIRDDMLAPKLKT